MKATYEAGFADLASLRKLLEDYPKHTPFELLYVLLPKHFDDYVTLIFGSRILVFVLCLYSSL